MPDEIDRLVDAETMMEAQALANRKPGLADEDRELLEAGAMTKDAARELTDQIKATATATYVLVHRAHELKCWMALGYKSWEDYVITEFDMSKSRSYQLINQAKVVEAIQEVVPDGTDILLTEAQARDVEKALPRITDRIKSKTEGQSPDEAAKTVQDVVEDERKQQKKESKSRTENDGVSLLDSDALDRESKKQEGKQPSARQNRTEDGNDDTPNPSDDDIMDDEADEDIDDFNDVASSTLAVGYIFAYVEGLSDPAKTAAEIDNPKSTLKDANNAIDWLTKFRDSLEERMRTKD